MTLFLLLPLWLTALLLVGVTTVLSMAGVVLVRRSVALERLSTNNEVAGFKFATVGVIYAVLVAFAIIVVWEKFSDAEQQVAGEAGSAAIIFRLADGLPPPSGTALRQALAGYLHDVVDAEWPAMQRGASSEAASRSLSAVYTVVLGARLSDARTQAIFEETLHQLTSLTQARRARLVVAHGVVPRMIWWVLFGGAFLTVVFTFFFGTRNLRAQTAMTGMLSVMIFSGLLVIVEIDHPFAGSIRVQPEPLEAVLADFAGAAAR